MKKLSPSNKILIAVPFWKRDQADAVRMVRLLADLEPHHSATADILFVRRFDCPPMRPDLIKHVARKFNVFQHRSARRETGWPQGCNGLFFGTIEYVHHMLAAGRIPNYKAVLNLAADVVPLKRDWLAYLHAQWDQAGVSCMGALIDGPHPHINGDVFLFSTQTLLPWLGREVVSVSARVGWDWALAPDFRARGWANIPGVISLWGTPTMSMAHAREWQAKGMALIHGVKDDSLVQHARKLLL